VSNKYLDIKFIENNNSVIMKICLINAPYREEVYGDVKDVSLLDVPLGICYLASVLIQAGHEVSLTDAEAERLKIADIPKKIEKENPDVIGLTCTTPMVSSVKKTAETLRNAFPEAKIIVGGPHVTAVPEDLLSEKSVDVAVIGEGEHTIVELVKLIEENKSLKSCKGIAFKEDGKIIRTEPRPLICDIDALPFPARHLLPYEKYKHSDLIERKTKKNYANIMSSRGCPYRCIFCGSRTTFGGVVRFRSPKLVVDEIEECYNKLDVGIFGFSDDTLTVKKEQNPKYYQLIKEFERVKGLPIIFNTSFNLRGEPIVRSPADAISTFMRSNMDYLILGDYVVTKK